MTIKDAIFRYNLLNTMLFSDGDYSVSRELKVKLIRYKLNFQKIVNEFTETQKKYIEEVKTPEYNELASKESRTKEENKNLDKIIQEINSELNQLINSKLSEEVETTWYQPLTEDEYNEILNVNVEHDVEINGQMIDSTSYVSLLHDYLV